MSQLDRDLLRAGIAYADRWVACQQDRHDIPGVVVAVRHEDELLLSRGYGYADLDRRVAMTPDHIFRIASHSKTFTATAIMQLVEQGRVRLDDPLATHVSWLRDQDGLARVTVRQALNHTTGIVRDGDDADYWQLEHPFPDADELRRLVEQAGAVLPANDRFKYSNLAYALLGQVVARAAGLPYADYVRQHIIDPLGLTATGPETDERARAGLATGYTVRRFGRPRRPLPDASTGALAPATGFYATAVDLCRYASGHFFGNDVLMSDAAKREMQQPYWEVVQADAQYGLGFAVQRVGERQLIGHGGSFPGFSTVTLFDPRDRLAVVALTNETGGPARDLAYGIVKILDYAQRQPRDVDRPNDAYNAFTGRFVNQWGVLDVAAFGATLAALDPDEADPAKSASLLNVVDADTLRIDTANGYGSPGEWIRYRRDAAGKTTAVVAGGLTMYPLEEYLRRPVAD